MSAQLSNLPIFEKILIFYARHFPIRRGKLRLINWLWQLASGDRDTHRLASLRYGGFKMPCDLSLMLQRQFYFFGTYFLEANLLSCWEKEVRGTKVIFDVGANAGIYCLAALAVQQDAMVYAFEPTPEIAAHLRETAALNRLDRLYVNEVAIFSETRSAVLKRFRGELGTNEGMNFISDEADDSSVERVQTITLDQFCIDHKIDHIGLMKIDIQGHEYSALKGAIPTLKSTLRYGCCIQNCSAKTAT